MSLNKQSLRNYLNINFVGTSQSKSGAQTQRETNTRSNTSDLVKRVNQLKNQKKPTQLPFQHNHSISTENQKKQYSQPQVTLKQIIKGEQDIQLMTQDSNHSPFQQILQKSMEKTKQLNNTVNLKSKQKSIDQYSSLTKTPIPSYANYVKPLNFQQLNQSKHKLTTEPCEASQSQRDNIKKNDNMSTQAIMDLISKINSQKQSLVVKSPMEQDVLGQNFKKLLNDYNQVNKSSDSNPLQQVGKPKFSEQKNTYRSNEHIEVSGFKTERPIYSDHGQTVTILLFDQDKTVTEYKFDSQCGTTDQLTKFLLSQIQKQKDVVGFSTMDKNISIDYYLSLKNRDLLPLSKMIINIQPIYRVVDVITLSLYMSFIQDFSGVNQLSLKSFHFLQCVGMGGFSRVYLVRSKVTGHFLALKLISKQFIVENQKQSIVQNERDVMVQLSQISTQNYTFLCKIECAFETKSWVCFGMEYCPGGELFNQLRKVKRMSEDQARIYFIQVCAAVGYLHESHVLYRDIKPENILLDEDGQLKLADFGLARPNMTSEDEAYSFCGSPEYMAPEMLQQKGHTYAVDYYCLGALLYELLTGLPPYYSRDTNKIFQSILYENLQFPPNLMSNQAKDLIKKLLSKDPDQRLGSQGGIKIILSHPWINIVNVENVLKKKVKPPFSANLISFNFDPNEFKKGENLFKQQLNKSLTNLDESQFKPLFKDFHYIGPNLLPHFKVPVVERINSQQSKSQLITNLKSSGNSQEKINFNSITSDTKLETMTMRQQSGKRVNSANTNADQRTGSTGHKQRYESMQKPLLNVQSLSGNILKKHLPGVDRNGQVAKEAASKQSTIQKRLMIQTNMKQQQKQTTNVYMKSLLTEPNDNIERMSFLGNGVLYHHSIQDESQQNSYRQIGKISHLLKK